MTATLTKWYEENGRHEIFAGGKAVKLSSIDHSLKLNAEHVAHKKQTDLDKIGVAKNAREEKIRARDLKLQMQKDAENRKMAELYRQVVLKEQKKEGFVSLDALVTGKPAKKEEGEAVGSFGD